MRYLKEYKEFDDSGIEEMKSYISDVCVDLILDGYNISSYKLSNGCFIVNITKPVETHTLLFEPINILDELEHCLSYLSSIGHRLVEIKWIDKLVNWVDFDMSDEKYLHENIKDIQCFQFLLIFKELKRPIIEQNNIMHLEEFLYSDIDSEEVEDYIYDVFLESELKNISISVKVRKYTLSVEIHQLVEINGQTYYDFMNISKIIDELEHCVSYLKSNDLCLDCILYQDPELGWQIVEVDTSLDLSEYVKNIETTGFAMSFMIDKKQNEKFMNFFKRNTKYFLIKYTVTDPIKRLKKSHEYLVQSENSDVAKNEFSNEWHDELEQLDIDQNPILQIISVTDVDDYVKEHGQGDWDNIVYVL